MVSGSGHVCLACAMFWVIGEEIPCEIGTVVGERSAV